MVLLRGASSRSVPYPCRDWHYSMDLEEKWRVVSSLSWSANADANANAGANADLKSRRMDGEGVEAKDQPGSSRRS